jgi:hypothetical protein
MITQETSRLMHTLLDKSVAPMYRADAARHLADWSTQDVLQALLRVAQEDDEDEMVSCAVGESIGKILIQRQEIDRAPLHDFNGSAYLAYDEAIGRYRRLGDKKALGG